VSHANTKQRDVGPKKQSQVNYRRFRLLSGTIWHIVRNVLGGPVRLDHAEGNPSSALCVSPASCIRLAAKAN